MSLMLNSNSDDSETLYSDSVFSTYLYTGNGATQTITNGIDLAGKGGLVWIKSRNLGSSHELYDTLRGPTWRISSNSTVQSNDNITGLTAFNSSGFSLGASYPINFPDYPFVAWTFREAAKFFDVVTYTGTGSARTIAHSLGVAPGMVIVKRTDTTSNWQVYSNGLTSAAYSIVLNDSVGQASAPTVWNSTSPTSSVFSVGTDATVNASGGTYVAYLYAHDTAADGIIQCGSYATNASYVGPNVNLGFEPAWILVKKANGNGPWSIVDTMRGWTTDGNVVILNPNSASEESTTTQFKINATGFQDNGAFSDNATMIYMAIRRPNKPPTSGTQVYMPIARTGTGAAATVTGAGFAPDLVIGECRSQANGSTLKDRLRGVGPYIYSFTAGSEGSENTAITSFNMDGISVGTDSVTGCFNLSSQTYVNHFFKRAPGFFDVVCYTGVGTSGYRAIPHNLTVSPELIIVKRRSVAAGWVIGSSYFAGGGFAGNNYFLNTNGATFGSGYLGGGTGSNPTATNFYVEGYGAANDTGAAGVTYVAYLFATLAGISKVGSYTGNGSSQNIECGFAAGARFVLVKATSTTGDWLVADTARGIVSGNDPRLSLNSTAAEVTGEDWLDPYAPGFTVNQTTASANASGVSYIFLAIS